MSDLAELFPAEDFRFHLTLRRGDLATFFAATPAHDAITRERARWLRETPARYAALNPGSEPLLSEFARTVALPATTDVVTAGATLEPDFLLLAPGAEGLFRLEAGALCFPTMWALEEKMGHTLEEIHGVVPGLNPALGGPLNQFLARLKPGPAYLRANWGLAATPELNLHPALGRPRLALPLDPEQVWLRVEHQALAALPETGGVVFGIRIALHPLSEVLADASVRSGFRRALATMPEALVAYKGLAPVREALLALAAD
ncbi:MAG TPA: heme-dependent oxidative N-demethylase subunit alpha family protein [Opitutaceae bacterium]